MFKVTNSVFVICTVSQVASERAGFEPRHSASKAHKLKPYALLLLQVYIPMYTYMHMYLCRCEYKHTWDFDSYVSICEGIRRS